MSYLGHSLWEGVLPLSRGGVSVFYSPSQLVKRERGEKDWIIERYNEGRETKNVVKLKGRTNRLLPPMSQSRVRHSKGQWVMCCICRQNSQRLCVFSNHPWMDKKQAVSRVNKRNEMWQWSCVNWIPFIATPIERNKKWQAKWPTSKFKNGTNVSYV